MSKPFTRLRRGGRGVMAAALVLLGLAGAAVGAPAASASIDCQWQPLSLQNGWHSEQSAWNSGDPAYCIDNGIVYLSGSLAQSGSTVNYFAGLPQQARPASNMYLSVYTYAGTTGVVQIDTDGTMYAYGGSATQFTSLAGISFPVASTAEQPITNLEYGWQSADSQWGTGNPSYYVSDGVVHLSGSLFNPRDPGSATFGTDFAVLPPAARPAADTLAKVYTYGGTVGDLNIFTDGTIAAGEIGGNEANATAFTSLAGVTYPAASSAETPLPLLNGWQSGQPPTWPSHAMSYYISNGVVYLDGAVLNTGSGKVAVLPPAARPTHTLYLTVPITWVATAILQINPDGSMYTYGGPPSAYNNQNDYTDFSGISFEAGE